MSDDSEERDIDINNHAIDLMKIAVKAEKVYKKQTLSTDVLERRYQDSVVKKDIAKSAFEKAQAELCSFLEAAADDGEKKPKLEVAGDDTAKKRNNNNFIEYDDDGHGKEINNNLVEYDDDDVDGNVKPRSRPLSTWPVTKILTNNTNTDMSKESDDESISSGGVSSNKCSASSSCRPLTLLPMRKLLMNNNNTDMSKERCSYNHSSGHNSSEDGSLRMEFKISPSTKKLAMSNKNIYISKETGERSIEKRKFFEAKEERGTRGKKR
jgi:hypothetical protein